MHVLCKVQQEWQSVWQLNLDGIWTVFLVYNRPGVFNIIDSFKFGEFIHISATLQQK